MDKSVKEGKVLAGDLKLKRDKLLNTVGNILDEKAPPGHDEEVDNETIVKWGKIPDIVVDGKTLGREHHN